MSYQLQCSSETITRVAFHDFTMLACAHMEVERLELQCQIASIVASAQMGVSSKHSEAYLHLAVDMT